MEVSTKKAVRTDLAPKVLEVSLAHAIAIGESTSAEASLLRQRYENSADELGSHLAGLEDPA